MRLHVNLFNESSTSGFGRRGVTAFHPTWQHDLCQHWKTRPLFYCESATVSVRYAVFVRPRRQKSLSYVIKSILWLRFVCGPGFCRVASVWFVQMNHVIRAVRLTMLIFTIFCSLCRQKFPLQSCWKTPWFFISYLSSFWRVLHKSFTAWFTNILLLKNDENGFWRLLVVL